MDGKTILPLAGLEVDHCQIDVCFRIAWYVPGAAIEYELSIGAPFVVTVGDTQHRLDPADPVMLGLALAVVRRATAAARATVSGDLTMTWTNGMQLDVAPDPRYEAWQLVGPGGLLVVCVPDGGLAIWQAMDGVSK